MTDAAREAKNEYQRKWREQLAADKKAARRAYKRKWAADHRDRCREYQARYWEKKAAQAMAERTSPAE